MIAIQQALPANQILIGLALLVFTQTIAGSIFIVAANTIFNQSLVSELAIHAPSLSPGAALAAGGGAAAVRSLVPPGSPELEGVLLSFSISVNKLFYLVAACAAASFICSWGMGWKDVRSAKGSKDGDAAVAAALVPAPDKDDTMVSLPEKDETSPEAKV
jgi:hypothetical protein